MVICLGKKNTQAKKKVYSSEGRTLYLPFHIKFNEDKDQVKFTQLHVERGENKAYQVIYYDLGRFGNW